MQIFWSDQFELLKNRLKRDTHCTQALTQKYLIVPSKTIKQWLMVKLAEENNIAMGFKIMLLEEAFSFFLEKEGKNIFLPTSVEIEIFLQEQILQILEDQEIDPQKSPLKDFLLEEFNQGKIDKFLNICSKLAELFVLYGTHDFGLNENWQTILWEKVLSHPYFFFPIKYLSANISFEEKKDSFVYLFGFSYIPKVYFSFFHALSKSMAVFCYFFSPCMHYWADFSSKAQKKYLRKIYEDQNHPLLENWGMLGRDLQKQVLDFDLIEKEEFSSSDMQNSLLNCLKQDLLTLRFLKKKDVVQDDSIQFYEHVGSRLREVEDLYSTLIEKMHSLDEHIDPSEILVLAPDIHLYAPFIHLVFGDASSALDYSITDLKISSKSFYSQGLASLLALFKSRWELDEVFELFQNPLFQKKFQFDEDEIVLLYQLCEKARVSWGFDENQKRNFLGYQGKVEGSFFQAIDKMLFAIAVHSEKEKFFPQMDFSKTELINRFIQALENLWEDIKVLREKSWSLVDLANYLNLLSNHYFLLPFNDPIENLAKENFQTLLEKFRNLSNILKRPVSFEKIYKIVQKKLSQKTFSFQKNHLRAVHFASLKIENIFPAKIIFLLGMEEDYFPRKDILYSMNFLKEYYPKKGHKDRYAFLQCVFMAQKQLCISYRKFCPLEGKELLPSSLVEEFISYLDQFYSFEKKSISSKLITSHFSLSFNPKYFEKKNYIPSRRYKACKAYLTKQKPPTLLEFQAPFTAKLVEKEIKISLKKLELLAKNPFQFFLNESLGIFLEEKKQSVFLSNLEKHIFLSHAILGNFKNVYKSFEEQNIFSQGILKSIEKNQLKKLYLTLQKNMRENEIEELFTWHFHSDIQKPFQEKNHWFFPSLELKIQNTKVYITGKIKNMSLKGPLFLKEGKFFDLISTYPIRLLYLHGCKILQKDFGDLFFLKSNKTVSASLENDEKYFARYIEYYFTAKKVLSPCLSPWVQSLLKKEEKEFSKKVKTSFQSPFGLKSVYEKWVFSYSEIFDSNEVFLYWSDYLRNVFTPLLK